MNKPHNIISINNADGFTLLVPPLLFADIFVRVIWSLLVLALGCGFVIMAIVVWLPGQHIFDTIMRKYTLCGFLVGPGIAALGFRLLVTSHCKTVFVIRDDTLHATERTWLRVRENSWKRSEIRAITLHDRNPGGLTPQDYSRHLVIVDPSGKANRFLAQREKVEIIWIAETLHDSLRLSE